MLNVIITEIMLFSVYPEEVELCLCRKQDGFHHGHNYTDLHLTTHNLVEESHEFL